MKKLYFIIILFFYSIALTYGQAGSVKRIPVKIPNSPLKEIRTGGYNFINPLLDYFETSPSNALSDKLLLKKINDCILKSVAEKKISFASVYYRDLTAGTWIGIHETHEYSPASLLKVPYMMAALYQAQQDSSFLSSRVFYDGSHSYYNQSIRDSFTLTPNRYYSINDLLYYMIVYSDNDAKDLLVQNISYPIYKEVFNVLGVDIAKYDTINGPADFLSVKEYASFFRILYNATFLNKQLSEYALWLLSNTTFNDGIKAGLPSSVNLSHKFGERYFSDTNIKQLHDCGIVYKPNTPYLLCIMTKGTDFKKMEEVIAAISKIIYTHIETRVVSIH